MPTRVEVTAELTASVIEVAVTEGQPVTQGQPLLFVESMKMEIPITAPAAGTVASLQVVAGDLVSEGDVLAVLDT